jgi:hypothetical protein
MDTKRWRARKDAKNKQSSRGELKKHQKKKSVTPFNEQTV